jgi:hypothetical protein
MRILVVVILLSENKIWRVFAFFHLTPFFVRSHNLSFDQEVRLFLAPACFKVKFELSREQGRELIL